MKTQEVDREQFRRACRGDRDAFWKVVLPYRGLIYSVALGMVRTPEQAEDYLHEVLVIAFRSLSSVRDPGKISSWLYSITHNHIRDAQRREKRLSDALQDPGAHPVTVVPVSELLEKEEWLTRMEEALSHLPEPFRVILGMKYMNDYSCREISDILGINITTVKSRLFEARKLLRKKTELLAAHSTEKERNHGMQ